MFGVPGGKSVFIYVGAINVDCNNDYVTVSDSTQKICNADAGMGFKTAASTADYNLTMILSTDSAYPYPTFDIYVFLAKSAYIPPTTTTQDPMPGNRWAGANVIKQYRSKLLP